MSAGTENINVPTFDGYECIGMRIPMYEDDCYVLNTDGSSLIHRNGLTTDCKMWIQVCYRKIKPKRIVFEFTGEVRVPGKGEWYKTSTNDYMRCQTNFFDQNSIREIYRIVEEQS
ncbi:hypothetical protein SAMN05428978_100534 [Nitrosomonas sp. Nm34]|nr:hypothetical protein SAMN05428978_100534 [Nitrosomonas sp. Nm34]